MTISQRNRFFEGDELEVMIKGQKPVTVTVKNLKNADGELINNAPHPMMQPKARDHTFIGLRLLSNFTSLCL